MENTYTYEEKNYELLLMESEGRKIQLDISELKVTYKRGLYYQTVLEEVTFKGAGLNLYPDDLDKEEISILASWGWEWDESRGENTDVSLDVLEDNLLWMVVTDLLRKI